MSSILAIGSHHRSVAVFTDIEHPLRLLLHDVQAVLRVHLVVDIVARVLVSDRRNVARRPLWADSSVLVIS